MALSWQSLLITGLGFLISANLSLAFSKPQKLACVALFISCLASYWEGYVTKLVPEPYLDEIFHIPQAQAYCDGKYDVWDPKLTTPPGLYAVAMFLTKISSQYCSVHVLRSLNCLCLVMTMVYAFECRSIITQLWQRNSPRDGSNWTKEDKQFSEDLHTAVNIALFPPLFFFSGLFYTDILSTCIVLMVYKRFLARTRPSNSSMDRLWLYGTGILALTIRQTNIFWVAVFTSALEMVGALKSEAPHVRTVLPTSATLYGAAIVRLKQYRNGYIHDIVLSEAHFHDFILCAISTAVAATFRPLILLTKLWPYVALVISFGGFVFWNGGVVLGMITTLRDHLTDNGGDKSNHVATIHLPQMLYVWPFIAFFSAPLVIPTGVKFLVNLGKLFSLPLFPRLRWKYMIVTVYVGVILSISLAIVRYNTIIHLFTLADNRHYMFYVFRYTILRHSLIRYLLVPIYLACAYLVYLTLCPPLLPVSGSLKHKKSSENLVLIPSTRELMQQSKQGPTTSLVLIMVVTSALSLITAPLVEPRYFIMPWVMWRLHVPPQASKVAPFPQMIAKNHMNRKIVQGVVYSIWKADPDYRLIVETMWFLLINTVTGYVFLFRGFEWPQQPGEVQRFMW